MTADPELPEAAGTPRAGQSSAGNERRTRTVQAVSPQLAHLVLGAGPPPVGDFADLSYEWRRLLAEVVGTFMLVLVAAGAVVVGQLSHGSVTLTEQVVAPALMVMAVILSIGAVSGAHLNPVVSVAFALRREFPWRRVPPYVVAQVAGGALAGLFLWAMFGKVGRLGATVPAASTDALHAMLMEAVLTFGLLTTILGTASGAQNVGPLSALAVGGYIALAGLWSAPISGASMNPVRSFAPDLVTGRWGSYWVYLAGPTLGMLVAVAVAYGLRGKGGDPAAARAAQGTLGTIATDNPPRDPEDRP